MASGDLYQTPSFAWLHALARAGSSAVTVVESVTAATPKTRLLDQRSTRRMIRSASGALTIRVDRGAVAREPVDRLVLVGHNLTNVRIALIKDTNQNGSWSATSLIAPYARLRGSTVGYSYRCAHAGVNVIDFPSTTDRYIGVAFEDRASNVHELGECWFTRKRTPATGLDPGYADPMQANLAVTRLQSGVDLVRELGSARRSWRFDTSRISGADRLLYDAMLRDTGYGRDRVLFDGMSGGYETVIESFSDDANGIAIGGWTTAGVTSFNGRTGGYDGDGIDAVMTTTGAAGSAAYYVLPTPIDLRGCIVRWATHNFSSTSHLTTTTGSWVQLYTSSGQATYQFGTNQITAPDDWYQLSVDVDTDAPASVAGGSFDASNVTQIALGQTVPSGTRVIYWDDLHYLRKDRAPLIARIEPEYSSKQEHPNPAASGEKRLLSLTVAEDLG